MGSTNSQENNLTLTVQEEHAVQPIDPANDLLLPKSSNSNITFQRLNYNDHQQVRALCEVWSDAFDDKRDRCKIPREQDIKHNIDIIEKYKINDINKLNGICIAIDERKEVIGGIMISLYGQMGNLQFPGNCRHECREGEAYIDWIGVHEDARGKGVGNGLLQFSENYAADNDCTFMSLHVVKGNRAKGLYERTGYEVIADSKSCGEQERTGCLMTRCCSNCVAWLLLGYCGIELMHKQIAVDLVCS